MKRTCYIAIAAIALAACSGRYASVPSAEVLAYQTGRTYGDLYNLSVAYAENLNAAVEADTIHPGMYAEYGITLALMGHRAEANRMLNSEAKAFPQSKALVQCIKQKLLPDFADDTLSGGGEMANMSKLRGWAYSPTEAARRLPYVAPVVDSTDTAWVRHQTPTDSVQVPIRLTANQKRELLAQEQQAAEARRQAAIDSVAAAKQAKIDARKQAQADKAKAKKDKAKAKKEAEKAKKQADKEKKQAAKDKKKASQDKKQDKKSKSKGTATNNQPTSNE
ncbi:MAG: DUF4810 domain-containing protein [Bacteroidales bacterium]|nr:DUF4810 domain-containing protein [Bacteroidales bacterium]